MPRYHRPSGWGYVYVIGAVGGNCKVGLSVNPYRRLTELKKEYAPQKLWLMRIIETDNMLWTERRLHNLLENKRVHGEWFDLDWDDFMKIDTIERNIQAYLEEIR